MSSTASQILRLELIGTGDQVGTWGNTTNTNLGTLLEGAIAGLASVSVTSANQALTATDYAADQARMAILTLTTTTSANFSIYAPPVSKTYVVYNNSAYDATIYNSTVLGNTTAAGTGITIPAGKILSVWSNGTNFYKQSNLLVSLTTDVSGTLPIANGGTGQTTAQAALNTLAASTSSGQYLRGNGSNVVMSAIQAGDVPTLNQNTTGSAGSVFQSISFSSSGGASPGTTYNGSVARLISFATVGAPSTSGTGASGTWGINISGNAATASSATTATTVSDGAITTTKIADANVTAAKLSGAQTGSAPVFGARAWGNVTSDTLQASGNVSSWDASANVVNLTTAMPTSYPAVVVNNVARGGTYATSITSSSFLVESWSSGGNSVDPTEVNFIVVG
jgi:hypothetical protein